MQKQWNINSDRTLDAILYRHIINKNTNDAIYVCIQLIVAWWLHMATYMWVNIVSRNGLLHDGTKPLPEQVLTYKNIERHTGNTIVSWPNPISSVKSSDINLQAILQDNLFENYLYKIWSKIIRD